ncbi:restriction endonuclease subunit S [Haemophilus influenzae]|uniref:restriction endonuclease subunit S n=1 Tax=Haemophilus influenzae TaxID=727 RepID=UPI0005AED34C|nr:restriction endonuclease subunit S [Haemophilus influenzae]KIP37742.1 hypothetical protein SU52_06160 [Haemophilus influenzae]MCK8977319.1 restriction endonuclease subunit S [Haemophilus influenzae]MCK9101471.1 restriction endonuclease subunit S [Haemophilus influenzae]MCK9656134.1 restriction endonuclease subunit S [Haemophilus influenzae]PRL08170.1 putative type-1 restriction enzyme specificity protein [Haemophilus influenzae]
MKNNRTFLEKLLDGAEVEWKTVKSLCNDNFWLMPATPEFDDNGTIPYITSKNIKGGKIDFQNTKYINEHVYQELSRTRCIIENDILISMIGTIGEAVIVKKEDLFFYGQNMYILRLNNKLVNYKFFLYYFTAPFILNSLLSKKNSSNQGYLKAGQIENLKIPIPPLSVQTEIVKILDALTALTSELTSELILRQKQYEYYRETLLSPDNLEQLNTGGAKKKLSDVVNIYLGLTYTPTYVENGVKFISAQNTSNDFLDLSNTKFISREEFEKSTSNAKPKRGDILFTRVGSNLGHPVIVDTDEDLCIFVSLGFLRVKDKNILNSYIKHWMNTNLFWKQVEKNVHGSAKVNLNTGWLKNFEIYIPPLEEQQRIVSILDKFETLTNSITEGLPLAIEQSQKRYEYYRELLLNFPGRE